MSDRTVHAAYEGMEIVRYDRAGKWFLEPTISLFGRQRVGVHAAARQALWAEANGGWVKVGLPGGQSFDRLVRKLDS